MNALEFLSDPLLRTPIVRDDNDFVMFLHDHFNNFKKLIDQVDCGDAIDNRVVAGRDKSKELCDHIIEAVNRYLDGNPSRAFDVMAVALAEREEHLSAFMPTDTVDHEMSVLYRMRATTEPGERLSRRDLFHIPFDKRHRVGTQRFSIPGLPCLYLGGSLYVCWEELNRPDFNKIFMARFRAAHLANIRVLNIKYRPQFWRIIREGAPDLFPKYAHAAIATAVLWPLIASCHIKAMHTDAKFKTEYIIPQIVLQWVRDSHDFDGVCYSSTHIASTFDQPVGQMNYVFPAKTKQAAGHCTRLLEQFEMSEALSWQLASVVHAGGRSNPIPRYTDFDVESVAGFGTPYINTDFFGMQLELCGLPCSKLS
jgi:hypothetical protein